MKWEYKKVPAIQLMKDKQVLIEKLNEWGQNGWELCVITNWDGKPVFFYFKRQLSEKL